MNPDDLTDDELDQLAADLAPRFPTGTHGDRVVLSRRQFAAAATGTLGAGALMALGVDEASAQAAGSVGTPSSPTNMYAYDLDVANSVAMNGNDIQNAGSVSTGETVISGVAVGSTTQFFDAAVSDSQQREDFIRPTEDVSTSAKTILPFQNEGAVVICVGVDQSFFDNQFLDLLAVFYDTVNTISSNDRNSPSGRTYSLSSGELQLAMASGTYNITATGTGIDPGY